MSAVSSSAASLLSLARFESPTIANAMEGLGIAPRQFTGPAIRFTDSGATPAAGVAVTGSGGPCARPLD